MKESHFLVYLVMLLVNMIGIHSLFEKAVALLRMDAYMPMSVSLIPLKLYKVSSLPFVQP